MYNPFFTRDDNYMAQVSMMFGSFNLHDEFFAKHQLNYLGDIVRVLFYTGARYNFYDVIVMLLDQDVLKDQIEKAIHRLDRDAGITAQQRLELRDERQEPDEVARGPRARAQDPGSCQRVHDVPRR